MSKNVPDTIPAEFTAPHLADAYRRGWNHGRGVACHNVPKLGSKLHLDDLGRVTVDRDNIREVHSALCYEAEANSRSYSPFEFTAHEFNSADHTDGAFDPDKEGTAEALWEAFDGGWTDALNADLAEYTDADYGIEDVPVSQGAMSRDDAMRHLSFAVDSALAERNIADMPTNARLVGWLRDGKPPMVVAVWSALSDTTGNVDHVDDADAADTAADILVEHGFFGEIEDVIPSADFVI